MMDNRKGTTNRVQHALARSAACGMLLLACVCPAMAEYEPTLHSEYQAVYDNGESAWPYAPPYPIEMVGVVINNPLDMLDYNSSGFKQWQVYFQALPGQDDFGGTAVYTNQAVVGLDNWQTVMEQLNFPTNSGGESLRYGDVIKVTATRPGLFYGGKRNINAGHPPETFAENPLAIKILERDTTPSVSDISLMDLMYENGEFRFDASRATGPEHYQASLVHLTDLLLVDPENWGNNGTVMVSQDGLMMPMKLGLDEALGLVDPDMLTTTPFSVTAILDQEAVGGDFMGEYRLWLTSADGLSVVPEPSSLVLSLLGASLGLAMLSRRGRTRRAG